MSMNREEIMALFQQVGALKTGHFLLTSGLHSDQYMQCAAVFQRPGVAGKLVENLVPQVINVTNKVDTVIAPAIGGINIGYEMARTLGCRFIFAERHQGVMTLRRGFTLTSSERVLVVEDVVTTGGSVQEVLNIVEQQGSKAVGVAALVDRSGGKVDFKIPFISLVKLYIKTFQPESCPLCADNIPLIRGGLSSL